MRERRGEEYYPTIKASLKKVVDSSSNERNRVFEFLKPKTAVYRTNIVWRVLFIIYYVGIRNKRIVKYLLQSDKRFVK